MVESVHDSRIGGNYDGKAQQAGCVPRFTIAVESKDRARTTMMTALYGCLTGLAMRRELSNDCFSVQIGSGMKL